MVKLYQGLRVLFGVCFALVALSVLSLNGYALALLAATVIWLLLRRGPLPRFTLLLLAGGLVLRICIVLVLHPPLESDFLMMYQAAQSLLGGDLSFVDTPYFSLWAYQSVFVAWEAMWLSLWNSPVFLELVGAVLSTGIICLLYRMARGWVSERAAQAACLLLTIFPYVLTLHTVLTNQIASAFFLTLGIWLLASDDCRRLGFWRFPLAGLALQCGNLLRSEGIIFVVAVLAWIIFEAVQHPETVKRLAAGMLALLVVYFAANGVADAVVRTTLNPYGVQNGDPGWKFVTGLNFDTSGGYSQEDWSKIYPTLDENYQITEQTEAVQGALIAERLSAGPVKLIRHMLNKLRLMWNADALNWALGHTQQQPEQIILGLISRGDTYTLICQFDRGLFYLAMLLAGFGLIVPRAQWKQRPAAAYLPYFVFFAAFCAMLLIEVQPRYAYLPQLFLFLAAAFGLDCLRKSGKEETGNA